MIYLSSGHLSLAFAEVSIQQLDNVSLNPGGAVAFGEVLPEIIYPEADLILLVGLGLPEKIKNYIDVQLSGLA